MGYRKQEKDDGSSSMTGGKDKNRKQEEATRSRLQGVTYRHFVMSSVFHPGAEGTL